MPYINNDVLDMALAYLDTNGVRLDICTLEPTTYTAATATNTLGNKTALSIGAPAARTPSGRKVVVAAILDGVVTATGTATHWAISDTGAALRLIATGALGASQSVTSGNPFTLTAFDVGIPGAA